MLFFGMTDRNSVIVPWPQRDLKISGEYLSLESLQRQKG